MVWPFTLLCIVVRQWEYLEERKELCLLLCHWNWYTMIQSELEVCLELLFRFVFVTQHFWVLMLGNSTAENVTKLCAWKYLIMTDQMAQHQQLLTASLVLVNDHKLYKKICCWLQLQWQIVTLIFAFCLKITMATSFSSTSVTPFIGLCLIIPSSVTEQWTRFRWWMSWISLWYIFCCKAF